ncbi:MAG: VanZ family protein [Faecalitalea cylindroides]
MLETISKIISNILTTLYQPFWFALILSILFMFVYMMYSNIKSAAVQWISWFKESVFFRKLFLLVFVTVIILFRTLLNRDMWANPLSDIMGGWTLYDKDGELTTEAIENFFMLVPFVFLLFWTYKDRLFKRVRLKGVLFYSFGIVFFCSLSIEFLQLLLRLGTFQLSDIFYNTLGGITGGLIYWFFYRLLRK